MSYIEQVKGLIVLAKEDLVIRFDGVSNNTFRKTITSLFVDMSILFSILISMALMLIITLTMVLSVMFIMWSKSTFNFISRLFKGNKMKKEIKPNIKGSRPAPQPAMSPFEDGTPIVQSKVYANKQHEKAMKAPVKKIDAEILANLQKAGL